MKDERILIVGCTGQVARPVAKAFAAHNEVWGVARFSNPSARQDLEQAGVQCKVVDLAEPDLSGLPSDFTYVLNCSVARTGHWATDLDVNVTSIGFIMEHCKEALAFLHCSTVGVYQPQRDHLFSEDDPLGDNHRIWEHALPFLSTYSISKIAAENMVRFGSKRWKLPSVICRLGVPYGDNGGWPSLHLDLMRSGLPIDIHPDRPNRFNPIHEEDIVSSVPALLAGADVPALVVNWCGEESSIEEWCAILGAITGIKPRFAETEKTIAGIPADLSRLANITGPLNSVSLEEGLSRMVVARCPELAGDRWSDGASS